MNFVNGDDQQCFRKYLYEFKKASMESLNADFFPFSAKIIKSFVLRNLIGEISVDFRKFTKSPLSAEVEIKLFLHIT